MHVGIGRATDAFDLGFKGKGMPSRECTDQYGHTLRYRNRQMLHKRCAYQYTVARDESDQVCVVLVVRAIGGELELQTFTRMQLRSFETAGGDVRLIEVGHLSHRGSLRIPESKV